MHIDQVEEQSRQKSQPNIISIESNLLLNLLYNSEH